MIKQLLQLIKKVPSKPSKSGAVILPEAVAAAIAELGITRPVVIKWSQGRHRIGCHRLKTESEQPLLVSHSPEWTPVIHSITVSTHVSPKKASKILWHELTHAAQSDRFEDYLHWSKASNYEKRHKGYEQSAHEREARAVAKAHLWRLTAHADNIPATVDTTRRTGKKVEKAEAKALEAAQQLAWHILDEDGSGPIHMQVIEDQKPEYYF